MKRTVLANKIGKTLFNVAKEHNEVSLVDNDLTVCLEAINTEASFITLMNNPNIKKETKCQIIDKAFEGVSKHVANVIKILANNLKINIISEVVEVYKEISNIFSNKALVKVESVYNLSTEELKKLSGTIKDKLNVENVEIKNEVDKSLIGGLKISYNGKIIDTSIKTRINEIKRKMLNI